MYKTRASRRRNSFFVPRALSHPCVCLPKESRLSPTIRRTSTRTPSSSSPSWNETRFERTSDQPEKSERIIAKAEATTTTTTASQRKTVCEESEERKARQGRRAIVYTVCARAIGGLVGRDREAKRRRTKNSKNAPKPVIYNQK